MTTPQSPLETLLDYHMPLRAKRLLEANEPEIAEVVRLAVPVGVTPDSVRLAVLRRTGRKDTALMARDYATLVHSLEE